jgi:hypothetical protein
MAARRAQFVGRADELALFQSALLAPSLPFAILYVFGPGGVGKSWLFREFASAAHAAGVSATVFDARGIEPSPDAFIAALGASMQLPTHQSPLDVLSSADARRILLLDTWEHLAGLDAWLREVFLPQLSEHVLVVLADRRPPSAGWRADPGWQALGRTLPLRNLSPAESRVYLALRSVPTDQHPSVLDFTRGHPLALSLVAELFAQRPASQFQPDAAPDMIGALLERLVQQVPGPAHRAALEACALTRVTTEPLLARMLDVADAHELFEWLRGLSFIEAGQQGIFPHDLAREALATDVRWRNPDWYADLHQRARDYYSSRLGRCSPSEQVRMLYDFIYLHRNNQVIRRFFEWAQGGAALALHAEGLRPTDAQPLVEMVREFEGDASAALADAWLSRQPEQALVVRDASQQPMGFVLALALGQASQQELQADPATRVAWDYLQRQAPPRPGERVTYFRFWMARDTYQAPSACQALLFVHMVRHYLTTPGLAFAFFQCSQPDVYEPVLEYADVHRLPAADFSVGERRYGAFGHDWRAVPPMAWLSLLAERETGGDAAPSAAPAPGEPIVVLSQPDFAAAVRDALQHFTRPDTLRSNPLLRSRLVLERAGPKSAPAERVAALQAIIKEAAEAYYLAPRTAKGARALHHTYLQPAPTQEAAAELLDLPFSTYRRHLTAGLAQVVESLWQRELQGP